MARMVRVAAAQMGPASEEKAGNVARIVGLIQQAEVLGVDLICFPELALSPYFAVEGYDKVEKYFEEELPSPETQPIFDAAKKANMAFVLPYAEKAANGNFNSAIIVDRDGTILTNYQKMHIPGNSTPVPGFKGMERKFFKDGELGFPVVESSLGKLGILICADRGFPEGWRILAIKGAELVFTPYNTSVNVPHNNESKLSAADELRDMQSMRMRGQACMNHFYVVAPGKAGFERNLEFIGDSLVISPWGSVLSRTKTYGDELAVSEVDLDGVTEYRDNKKVMARRRPEMYGELVNPIEKVQL
jgi:N-carbamoyl-D-amino-acid hydrolase